MSWPELLVVRRVWSDPSAFITKIPGESSRQDANAILVPSGDHAGLQAFSTSWVMLAKPLPSLFTTKTAPGPRFSPSPSECRRKAILAPPLPFATVVADRTVVGVGVVSDGAAVLGTCDVRLVPSWDDPHPATNRSTGISAVSRRIAALTMGRIRFDESACQGLKALAISPALSSVRTDHVPDVAQGQATSVPSGR
jgi:hypothetical protein